MAERPRHRFEKLARELRAEIQSGAIAPGALLPTERELQETHNLSRTTVRRALAELISMGWAEAVPNRGVAAKIGHSPTQSTRVAFIDHRDYVHKTLFFRLHRLLEARGYTLVHVDSQDTGTIETMEAVAEQDFAAAVVWPKISFAPPGFISWFQARMPLIFLDHGVGSEPMEVVMGDHELGARLAVAHLISLGRKRIAISGYFAPLEDATLRYTGFVGAHEGTGQLPDAHDIVFSSRGGSEFEDTRLLSYRLQQPDRPDAVFVTYDMSVPAIVEAIYEAGLRVPNDIAVVGFGNDLPFTIDGVGLTTIAIDWESVAEAVVTRIFHRLGHPSSPHRRTLVPTRLVVRGSCGAPVVRWNDEPYEVSSITVTGRMTPGKTSLQPTSSMPFQRSVEPTRSVDPTS